MTIIWYNKVYRYYNIIWYNNGMDTNLQGNPCRARQMLGLYALRSENSQCGVMLDSCAYTLQCK
jgi:hypothetical protein